MNLKEINDLLIKINFLVKLPTDNKDDLNHKSSEIQSNMFEIKVKVENYFNQDFELENILLNENNQYEE